MSSRERALAAARGGEVDRKPVFGYPTAVAEADVVVGAALVPGQVVLAECLNPFGLARRDGVNLNDALSNDPDSGNELLDSYVQKSRESMLAGLSGGADGILYRLHGARESLCTPMQYGGYYLERDRELLGEVKDAYLNVVLVVGEEDVYLDFVSDLPAHVFAWDSKATGVTASQVREMRSGALASEDPQSEFLIAASSERWTAALEA